MFDGIFRKSLDERPGNVQVRINTGSLHQPVFKLQVLSHLLKLKKTLDQFQFFG